MADETTETTSPNNSKKSMLDQARDAVLKAARDGVMNKLKEIAKKRMELEKGIALCDAEAAKIQADFEAGIL